jgi:hypothetical protein
VCGEKHAYKDEAIFGKRDYHKREVLAHVGQRGKDDAERIVVVVEDGDGVRRQEVPQLWVELLDGGVVPRVDGAQQDVGQHGEIEQQRALSDQLRYL